MNKNQVEIPIKYKNAIFLCEMRRLWLFLQSVDQVTSTEKYEAKIQELLGAMPKKNVAVRPDEWSL